MRNLLLAKVTLSALGVISCTTFAQNSTSSYFRIEGSHVVTIPVKSDFAETSSYDLESLMGVKTITLMKITPTQEFLQKNANAVAQMIAAGGEIDYSKGIKPFKNSKNSVDLGMENVPVLDQGRHGTCVTFAATAALDAKLKIGDYIDQQCSLALNKYLGNDYWNGAYDATEILAPLKEHGIIPKGKCFGVKYANPNQTVDTKTYESKSIKNYSDKFSYEFVKKANLNTVKSALKNGYRVAIGTALTATNDPISVNGFNAIIQGDDTSYRGGLWACQQKSSTTNYCKEQNAGHEVVVIGYDDNQQLLKIRNSWSTKAGQNGDYYMTYSFFNAMALDHTTVK
ncbi:C1 family peptidase [Silvanigrella aquatica]|uniref:Peptidase C1A papain C-terminal domain-containing protein n=1 Tax=Silvanigrella aquatica TaxID=1915309 RepID=A0A1L4CYY1_9BACT|nr:C1 family peptidase [Silvanigrella aquatica]APJ03173.1 hypothetical protein AXG55_04345 [Silvanigrella aquatica]